MMRRLETARCWRYLSILCSLLLGYTLAGWAQPPTTPMQALVAGEVAMAQHQYATAITAYQQFLAAAPDHAVRDMVLCRLARCQEAHGALAQAVATLTTLCTEYPASAFSVEGRLRLCADYTALGRLPEANAVREEISRRDCQGQPAWRAITLMCETLLPTKPREAMLQLVAFLEETGPTGLTPDTCPPAVRQVMSTAYRRLIEGEQYDAARTLRELLTPRLHALSPQWVVVQQDLYNDAWTRHLLTTLYQRFSDALAAGDQPGMVGALTALNQTVPEYPQAIKARQQYRDWVAAQEEK